MQPGFFIVEPLSSTVPALRLQLLNVINPLQSYSSEKAKPQRHRGWTDFFRANDWAFYPSSHSMNS